MSYATCHTNGCGNADISIDVGDLTARDPDTAQPILDDDGNPQMMDVYCGPCGQPITDISDSAPAEPADTQEGMST